MGMRESILGARDRKTVRVPTPEWEGCPAVWVRTLSARERMDLQAAVKKDESKSLALTVAMHLSDETGNRVMSDEDVTALEEKSAAILDRIATAAWQLYADSLSAETAKELEKNSSAAPTVS